MDKISMWKTWRRTTTKTYHTNTAQKSTHKKQWLYRNIADVIVVRRQVWYLESETVMEQQEGSDTALEPTIPRPRPQPDGLRKRMTNGTNNFELTSLC